MQICDFRIVVNGPAASRGKLAELLRTLPKKDSADYLEPVIVLDAILSKAPGPDDHSKQKWFWVGKEFLTERPSMVVIAGSMQDSPPLMLMQELFLRFPDLVLDCYSVTEHERYEHWLVGARSEMFELIEELVVDGSTNECQKHILKAGEVSRYKADAGWQIPSDIE